MTEPIHLISLGAGVQSSTMALMAAHGELTPMPTAAIFADTQAEPESVYRWLDWLETQLPFPVYRVTAGNIYAASLKFNRSKVTGLTHSSINIPLYTLTGMQVGKIRCLDRFPAAVGLRQMQARECRHRDLRPASML